MFCTKCGKQITLADHFCPRCGAAIHHGRAHQEENPDLGATQADIQSMDYTPKEGKLSYVLKIIGGIILCYCGSAILQASRLNVYLNTRDSEFTGEVSFGLGVFGILMTIGGGLLVLHAVRKLTGWNESSDKKKEADTPVQNHSHPQSTYSPSRKNTIQHLQSRPHIENRARRFVQPATHNYTKNIPSQPRVGVASRLTPKVNAYESPMDFHFRDLYGWIFFPIFSLVVSLFVNAYQIVTDYLVFIFDGSLVQCFSVGTGVCNPEYGILTLLEFCFALIFIFMSIILLRLLSWKSVAFPKLMSSFFLLLANFQFEDLVLSQSLMRYKNFPWVVWLKPIFCSIWIFYFRYSEKVKRTFTNPYAERLTKYAMVGKDIFMYFVIFFTTVTLILSLPRLFSPSHINQSPESLKENLKETITNPSDSVPSMGSTLILPSGWTKIEIEDIGSFHIPPTLEARSKGVEKAYQYMKEKVLNFSDDTQSLVIQPSGMNELRKGSTRRYARIILRNIKDEEGTYLTFQEQKEMGLPNVILDKLDNEGKSSIERDIRNLNRAGFSSRLIKWYPVTGEPFGGSLAVKTSYVRQAGDHPPVYVEEFKVQNNDTIHVMTFSYRVEEHDFWKADFEGIKRSVRFIER